MYLLKNPQLHNALATIAAISAPEWDILISGRFDGFLWSGAEDTGGGFPFTSTLPSPHIQSRAPSRGPTTSSYSTGPTPFSPINTSIPTRSITPATSTTSNGAGPLLAGAPVQLDEDTELAVLAEVEREIFLGMDAIEDAVQALHLQAQNVRLALQRRGAGLAMQARMRREEAAAAMGRAGTGTPGVGPGIEPVGAGEGVRRGPTPPDDDGFSDVISLAPDDSASNIGWKARETRRARERDSNRERRRDDRERQPGSAELLATEKKKKRGLFGFGKRMDEVREEE